MQTSLWLFHTQAREYFCLSDLRLCHPHLWSLTWNTVFFKHLSKLVFECVIHMLKAGSVFYFEIYIWTSSIERWQIRRSKRGAILWHILAISLSIYIYIYIYIYLHSSLCCCEQEVCKIVELLENKSKCIFNVYNVLVTCLICQ